MGFEIYFSFPDDLSSFKVSSFSLHFGRKMGEGGVNVVVSMIQFSVRSYLSSKVTPATIHPLLLEFQAISSEQLCPLPMCTK